MNNETRAALESSIRHWEKNVAAKTPEEASVEPDCEALCKLFIRRDCNGCPVSQHTRLKFCRGSSYKYAKYVFEQWEEHKSDNIRKYWRKAAQIHLDFLKSLRQEATDE